MNYRDFFKKNKSGKILLPEGVNPEQLKVGIKTEKEHTKDIGVAAKIALDHLKEDPNYYTKLNQAGLEEGDDADDVKDRGIESSEPTHQDDGTPVRTKYGKEEYKQDSHNARQKKRDQRFYGDSLPRGAVDEESFGSEEDSDGSGEVEIDADSEEGMPKVGGALAIPHVGQPIHMSKIIQVGASSNGQSATGELSGYTAAGGAKDSSDKGGIPVTPDGDKETITAGGKKVDSSIASKSVGGDVVPGEGQKQGGNNTKGSIAGTPKMKGMTNEHAAKLRNVVKQVLKEIKFDKATGKFVAINENVKGNSGKKVDMKMGPSYKVVQPTQCKTVNQDTARTNQYEPEITESAVEDEEISMMQERYQSLVNAPRNLKESELAEMNKLKLKLETIAGNGTSYKIAAPCQAQIAADDHARSVQSVPDMTEMDNTMAAMADLDTFDKQNPQMIHKRKALGQGGKLAEPSAIDAMRGQKLSAAKFADLDAIHRELDAKKNPPKEKEYDTTPYRGPQLRAPDGDEDWSDEEGEEGEAAVKEAGLGSVQHRSFRTIDDAPQNPKARWSDEVQEGSEPKKSETVKQIEKSNKGSKKSKPLADLKHKAGSKTKSGIVLQKK